MKNKALKRLIYALSAFVICFTLFSFKSVPSVLASSVKKDTLINSGFKLKTIIVDAGHGDKVTGTGHFSRGASGSYSTERGVTLAIALKLQKAIEKNIDGVNAVLTRTTEEDVSWEQRAQIANENKGNLFISIHCNSLADRTIHEKVGTKHGRAIYRTASVPDRSGKGVLFLVYGLHRSREEANTIKHIQIEEDAELNSLDPDDPVTVILTNQYMRKFRQLSINFSNILSTEFVDTDGRISEGIREQGLYLLCHTAMPSVMIETGYINNPDEEAYLNSEEGQNEIVASIVRGIQKYKDKVESK